MAVICTVRISKPLSEVRALEAANPGLMKEIGDIASRHMLSHRRLAAGEQVMDLDEFGSEKDYRAFISEAGEAIHRYGNLMGTRPEDTIWLVVDG